MKGEVAAVEEKVKNGLLNWGSSRLDSCSNLLVDFEYFLCAPQQSPL